MNGYRRFQLKREDYFMSQSRMVQMARLVGNFFKVCVNKDRYLILTSLSNHMVFLRENRLPVEYLVRLFPGIENETVSTDVSVDHHFALPYGESTILSAIIRHMKPHTVFEFGTFTGLTTKIIADLSPKGTVIHTIDLPADEILWEPWIAEVIGQEFLGRQEYQGRIISHRFSTRRFNFTPFASSIDLVFVDASHEYEDVVHDSRRAIEIVSDCGVVIWDDYQPTTLGVVAALNEIAREAKLVRVANSRLVLYRKSPFPGIPSVHLTPWTDFPERAKPELRRTASPTRTT